MPNALTGDYDAIVQIAVRQVNALLATLHQNGATPDAPLQLLHSASIRVGERRRRPPEVDAFGEWVLAYQEAHTPVAVVDLRAHLTRTAPPGAARSIDAAFGEMVVGGGPPPDPVRGRADVQISSPALSLPQGSTSEVTIHTHIRAHYRPEPDTTEMPEPVHGEVRAVFEVQRVPSATGRRLRIRPSPQDSKIQFIPAPGSGLSQADAGRIATQIRRTLREQLLLLPVDLPPDFPFDEFKGVGAGASQALVLPLQLSGTPPPAGGLEAVTQSVIGGSGFAFAVRKEYVESLLDLQAIRQAVDATTITVTLRGPFGISASVTYRLRLSAGPTLTFRAGAIDISGRVEVETSTFWAPNGSVQFKQAVTLELLNQRVRPRRLGEPEVTTSLSLALVRGRVVDAVKIRIDAALASAAGPMGQAFDDARQSLVEGVRSFDGSASASYTAVVITADGVIVRGDLDTATRPGPVILIRETDRRDAFSALESWIPGGRIERLAWSWVEYPAPSPLGPVLHPVAWSGVSRSSTDEHRFIFPKPAGITDVSHVCLRIEGTRVAPNGSIVSVAAGATCEVPEPGVLMSVPSWWEPVTVPVWSPDLAESAVVRSALAGHVAVQTEAPKRAEPACNALVYFDDWRSATPLAPLAAALSRRRRKSISPLVIIVVPPGSFDASRRELDAKVASIGDRLLVRVQVTEDDDGGWSRTFARSRLPSAYIINARREFAWKHEGEIDPGALAAALDEHLVPAPPPRFRPLRLAVAPGDRAPDALFQDHTGQLFALHRLRGHRVLLSFWQSWSAPCLAELRRLERLRRGGGPGAPLVVALHGGKAGPGVDDVHTRLGSTLIMAQDPEQRIARTYGVRCWPTTVSVDPDGRVDHVQFGLARDGESAPEERERSY